MATCYTCSLKLALGHDARGLLHDNTAKIISGRLLFHAVAVELKLVQDLGFLVLKTGPSLVLKLVQVVSLFSPISIVFGGRV